MQQTFLYRPPTWHPRPRRVQLTSTPAIGTLRLSGSGYEFGDGNDPATMAVLSAESMSIAVYADAVPLGSAIYTATGQVTDSNGRLADIVSASLAIGTTYIVVVQNEADSEVWAWRMAAS